MSSGFFALFFLRYFFRLFFVTMGLVTAPLLALRTIFIDS